MLETAHLTPQAALALYYRLAAGLAFITLGLLAWSQLRTPKRSGTMSPAIHPPNPTQLWMRRGLGALWLIDGFLQAQPSMVTRFVGGALAPLVAGQPAWIAWLIHWGITIWAVNPPVFNALATFIQIGIGLSLLLGSPRVRRAALWVSIGWGAVVWVGGEGLGGVLVGGGWLTGAPGSVLLYALAAVWLLIQENNPQRPAASADVIRWALAAVLGLNALLQALPGSGWWSGLAGGYVDAMAAMPQPAIFSAPLALVAKWLNADPVFGNVVIITGLILAALGLVGWPKNRLIYWLVVIWVGLGWWLGQDFGVLGGMGTDPNTGAVLLWSLIVYGNAQGWVQLPGSRSKGRREGLS